MKKIFVNARFLSQSISGVQRYAIECSRQIKRLHPETVFLAPKNILHKDISDELEVRIIGSNNGHLWEQLDLPLYLRLKYKNVPLLNLSNTAPLFYSNNYTTIHDLAFYRHPEWNSKRFSTLYNFLIPKIARKSKHIFTVSDTMRNEIIKYLQVLEGKVSITYNGLSEDILSRKRDRFVKEKIILSVGSFNLRKNHQHLIDAFLKSAAAKSYKLIIIGDKHKVFATNNLIEKGNGNNNIEIHQRLSENELMNMYCKAEILVSLSAYEGFGIPLLEGLYFDCKVLCSDIPVYRELYDKYVYFCDPFNINNIKQVIEEIAKEERTSKEIAPLLDKYNYTQSAKIILEHIFRPI